MSKFPRSLRLLDGRLVRVAKLWPGERAKGVYRVEYRSADRPKGCLATVEGDAFHEITSEEVLRDARAFLRQGTP